MERAGLRGALLELVRGFHFFPTACICEAGQMQFFLAVSSGIDQGCPLLGSLGAICMSPSVHRLESVVAASDRCAVGACAGSVGTVVHDGRVLKRLWRVFRVAVSLASLVLKMPKGILVSPSAPRSRSRLRRRWRSGWPMCYLPGKK